MFCESHGQSSPRSSFISYQAGERKSKKSRGRGEGEGRERERRVKGYFLSFLYLFAAFCFHFLLPFH